jgi:endoglycosylceramidase
LDNLNLSAKEDTALMLDRNGFRDRQGRLVYFRGINLGASAKLPPFIPFEDPKWWDLLASWGYNMVRLTIFWEAIEPEPGVYDQRYLDRMEEMVDEASKRGIYVLLDMHQDQYSRCLKGDGAPYWALPENVDPQDNSGISGSFWFSSYFISSDVRTSFSNFFKSDYLKGHYYNSWKEVAKRVNDNPYVLGYDIMNEPFGGEIPNDKGQFENGFLRPFYCEAISAIREVDPDAVGFVEPSIIDLYKSRLSSFESNRLVYAPHIYRSISWRALLSPNNKGMSFNALADLQQEKADDLEMPLFIGEFGVPWDTNPIWGRDRQVNEAMAAMEGRFISNAYWDLSVENGSTWNGEDYSLIDDEGRPRGLEVNVRPYVRRLGGWPIHQSFNPDSKEYSLVFDGSRDNAPTILYIPETVHYPEGFTACISDGSVKYNRSRGELWYLPGKAGYHYINITSICSGAGSPWANFWF